MFELEVVLNVDFGGFSISEEMSEWLRDNRNWSIIENDNYDYSNKTTYPLETLVRYSKWLYFSPFGDEVRLRSNKDLIDCVRYLKDLHKNDLRKPGTKRHETDSLEIKKIKLSLYVEDYYDGKEKINYEISELD